MNGFLALLAALPALVHVPGHHARAVLDPVPTQHQVSIEQRVIVRIGPSAPMARRAMATTLSPAPLPGRFKEKKLKGCVPIAGIAALLPYSDNRLLLYMRDRRLIGATLDKACHAEEFYSGAYITRSEDGLVCAHRERLQSRTGASCEVARLNTLVRRR
jgi:hypothetical protein